MPKPPTQTDFPPGARVRYRARQGERCSLPGPLYVDLGAVPAVSAVVLPGTPGYMRDSLYIRPDGWPLPVGVFPEGFGAEIERLENYNGPPLYAPITNGVGVIYTPDEIERILKNYLAKRK